MEGVRVEQPFYVRLQLRVYLQKSRWVKEKIKRKTVEECEIERETEKYNRTKDKYFNLSMRGVSSSGFAVSWLLQDCQCLKFRPIWKIIFENI